MANQFSAVIFDLDGLLVDSEPVQLEAWTVYLRRFNEELTPKLRASMYGRRLVDTSQTVVETLDLPVDAAEVARERDAIFLQMVPGAVFPMPGARELVTELRNRGTPIALATSGHRRYVDLVLESAGLAGMFTVEVTGEMVEHGKPAPDTFLRAARELDLPPETCLVLEDSPNGVRAAKAAGMTCFAIPGPEGRRADYADADRVLRSLQDVLPLLQRWGAGESERQTGARE